MINNKEIVLEEKKYCKVCGKAYYDGIIFIKTFICEECLHHITTINCSDEDYEYTKDKIKGILFRE